MFTVRIIFRSSFDCSVIGNVIEAEDECFIRCVIVTAVGREELVEIGVKSEYSCIVLLALLVWPGDLILRVTKGTISARVCL